MAMAPTVTMTKTSRSVRVATVSSAFFPRLAMWRRPAKPRYTAPVTAARIPQPPVNGLTRPMSPMLRFA
ncbi:hypothetical protein AWC07_11450 [Mycobacterium gastri]|uniref:Uncharacterized protein n=1 Tax=Mycobacterium gastri TaxID=1777 RepID=A0A1X1VAC1_MYCGS|nr:hypothetical protein AWC07_11450 [Mycobacterium gastri]